MNLTNRTPMRSTCFASPLLDAQHTSVHLTVVFIAVMICSNTRRRGPMMELLVWIFLFQIIIKQQ
jgi:hypothetical protein